MLYPSMKTLLKGIGNRYLLVNVVARRAREIAEEAEELGEPLNDKPVTLAIEEIADGALTIVQRPQKEESAERAEHEEMEDASSGEQSEEGDSTPAM